MPAAYEAADIRRHIHQINDRFRALEEQMARVSAALGLPYEQPGGGVPEEVVELVRAGKELEAIKRLRELTGAGFDEARATVSGL